MLLVARINGLEDFDVDVHSRARQLRPYKMAVNIAEQLAYQWFSIDIYLRYAWKELEFHIASPAYAPFIIHARPCMMELRTNKESIVDSRLDVVGLLGFPEGGVLYAILDLWGKGPGITVEEFYASHHGKSLPRLFPMLLL